MSTTSNNPGVNSTTTPTNSSLRAFRFQIGNVVQHIPSLISPSTEWEIMDLDHQLDCYVLKDRRTNYVCREDRVWTDSNYILTSSRQFVGLNTGVWLDESPEWAIEEQSYCHHNFIKYTGITETYEFCEHCDLKRGEQK